MRKTIISLIAVAIFSTTNIFAQDDDAIHAQIDSLKKEREILQGQVMKIDQKIKILESNLAVQEVITESVAKPKSRGKISRNAKIRKEPNAFSDVVGNYKKGIDVVVSDYMDEYYFIEGVDGEENGWVHKGYLVESAILNSYAKAAELRRAEEEKRNPTPKKKGKKKKKKN
ncbi:SH3 domain-containing protein [Flammeovirgaceae bacterium SG7u.111]|nr:SH3 domain-containing protein [Flammeovirgaceae bacterium SG7u.132]WPO35647.1 SH3 domain-containing protein [Flammeovirgaceae bacterium SG7u.111]